MLAVGEEHSQLKVLDNFKIPPTPDRIRLAGLISLYQSEIALMNASRASL